MRRIFLLRHAKAAWPGPGMRDFDRTLHERGRNDAHKLGKELAERGLIPAAALCSPARRVKETWQLVSESLPEIPVEYDGALYNGDVTTYLRAIESATASPLLIVGHNPMLEDIAHGLNSGAGDGNALSAEAGYPAGGFAAFIVPGEPGALDVSGAELEHFIPPNWS